MNIYFRKTHQRAFGTYPLTGDVARAAILAADGFGTYPLTGDVARAAILAADRSAIAHSTRRRSTRTRPRSAKRCRRAAFRARNSALRRRYRILGKNLSPWAPDWD